MEPVVRTSRSGSPQAGPRGVCWAGWGDGPRYRSIPSFAGIRRSVRRKPRLEMLSDGATFGSARTLVRPAGPLWRVHGWARRKFSDPEGRPAGWALAHRRRRQGTDAWPDVARGGHGSEKQFDLIQGGEKGQRPVRVRTASPAAPRRPQLSSRIRVVSADDKMGIIG